MSAPPGRPASGVADRQPGDLFRSHLNCRYYVTVEGLPRAVFSDVSGLQVQTEVTDYAEGGINSFVHRLPGRTTVGNLTLKRGVARSNDLLRWYLDVTRGHIVRRGVTVVVFETTGARLMSLGLHGAFPVRWSGPALSAAGQGVAIEELELAHAGPLEVGE